MADSTTKQRYISTSIWDDDWFWAQDDSQQKLYFYLLTNKETNVSGVYQISLSRIARDTRWTVEDVESGIGKLSEKRKAFYRYGYIVLPSAPRHQKWQQRPTIQKAIIAVLRSLPRDLVADLQSDEIGYQYPIDTICQPDTQAPHHTDTLDSDHDSDSDSDSESSTRKVFIQDNPQANCAKPVDKSKGNPRHQARASPPPKRAPPAPTTCDACDSTDIRNPIADRAQCRACGRIWTLIEGAWIPDEQTGKPPLACSKDRDHGKENTRAAS